MVGKRVIKRLKENTNINVYTAGRGKENTDIYIDLEQIESEIINPNIEIDVIIHCAASFFGDDIDGYIKNGIINSLGSIKIGELAIQLKCKQVIYISTTFSINHIDNEYYGSYGLTKKHGADYLKLICQNAGIQFVELLVSQIYDEYGDAKKHQSLFYFIIDKASRGEEITIYGDLDVTRNFLFIEDLVTSIEKIVIGEVEGSFLCCYSRSYKISEIAKIAYDVFGKEGTVVFDSTKLRLKKTYFPSEDNSLYSSINYEPQTDLVQGISLIKKALYQ